MQSIFSIDQEKLNFAELIVVEIPAQQELPQNAIHLINNPESKIIHWTKNKINFQNAVRIGIVSPSKEWLATVVVSPGTDSKYKELSRSVLISDVAVNAIYYDELINAILYLALRRGRIWGFHTVVSYISPDNTKASLLGLKPLVNMTNNLSLPSEEIIQVATRLDIALYKIWTSATKKNQSFLRQFFVEEAIKTLQNWLNIFYENPWFQAVKNGTLSREQYIYTLANTHQYVRLTTGLIGRAVGYSNNPDLRRHWLNHLKEEVDHERIIERDLDNLGADVDYVCEYMTPNVLTQEFMVAQESAIAFHTDPVVFMAAPFVAEGFCAHLDNTFIEALEKCAYNWGTKNPKLVTKFFASHINFDGGTDGHWEGIFNILPQFLTSDKELQRFLNLARLCMNAFERNYTSYIEDLSIFTVHD